MTVHTKICGIATAAAADAAIAGGALWLGYVFFARSPRNLDFGAAAALVRTMPAHVGSVAVMVDPDPAAIAQVLATGVTALQLHGDESPEQVAALRRPGLEVWKAVPIRTRADLETAKRYRGAADRLVYDAKTPPGTLPGGMGLRFDWRLLDGFDHPLPWLLSGGLDAESLSDAVGLTGARAVDVSSGVESAPGIKDVDKIARFLQAAARL